MPYDINYPTTYYCTIKGIEIRYCKYEGYSYAELYKQGDNNVPEIDISIRNKEALKYVIQFLKTILNSQPVI